MLATFTPDDWSAPTVCDRWSVRDIVGHLDGHAEEILRPWLFPFRDRTGTRRHPELARLDAHMEAQVDVHRRRSVDDLRRRFRARLGIVQSAGWPACPSSVRARGIATGIEAMPHLTLGALADVIYLRDLWMHRDDICGATGRAAAPQPHDAEVVAQVLRELDRDFWSGPGVVLELTGDAAAIWAIGAAPSATQVRTDTRHFMRLLAGHASSPELALVHGDADHARRAGSNSRSLLDPIHCSCHCAEDPAMQTNVDEIAPDVFRLSTFVPDVGPTGLHVQPVPRPRRRAVPLPHRDAAGVPARLRRRSAGSLAGRPAALDLASATSRPTSAAR